MLFNMTFLPTNLYLNKNISNSIFSTYNHLKFFIFFMKYKFILFPSSINFKLNLQIRFIKIHPTCFSIW